MSVIRSSACSPSGCVLTPRANSDDHLDTEAAFAPTHPMQREREDVADHRSTGILTIDEYRKLDAAATTCRRLWQLQIVTECHILQVNDHHD